MNRFAVGLVSVAVLAGLALWALAERDAALRGRALVEAAGRPAAIRVRGGRGLPGGGDAASLAALIADRSSAAGIRLSVKPLAATIAPGFAAVDVDARGHEDALRALARAIEAERPIIRFVRWSIRPAADGLLRLNARAVAPIGDRR